MSWTCRLRCWAEESPEKSGVRAEHARLTGAAAFPLLRGSFSGPLPEQPKPAFHARYIRVIGHKEGLCFVQRNPFPMRFNDCYEGRNATGGGRREPDEVRELLASEEAANFQQASQVAFHELMPAAHPPQGIPGRSEERRVGKEGRSRWS